MKTVFICAMLLMAGIPVFPNTPDTTATSFEIHLKKRSSEYSLAFNSCSIDRSKLYNSVMQKIQRKVTVNHLRSLQQPLVTLKFHEYATEKEPNLKTLSDFEKVALSGHNYDHYIKVCGHLNPSTPLNPFRKATFTLKVYVFDSKGNLIASSKGKSSAKTLNDFFRPGEQISEEQFISFVSEAANNIHLQI